MRCPDCNKFVAYDDSNEPEADDADIDEEGSVSGTVRVYLACAECGTELKEANFDLLNIDYTEAVAEHRKTVKEADDAKEVPEEDRDEHELEIEVETELTSRTEGKGRGLKTFYGYHATAHVKCSCGHEFTDQENSEDMQASQMDELT